MIGENDCFPNFFPSPQILCNEQNLLVTSKAVYFLPYVPILQFYHHLKFSAFEFFSFLICYMFVMLGLLI